jgi:hypothetical protein
LADAQRHSTALRRAAGLMATIGLLVAAIAYYRMVPPVTLASGRVPSTTAPIEPSTPPPSTATPLPTPTPTLTVTASPTATRAPTTLAPPSEPPPKDLPAGPGTTEPGILLIALPNADGSFEVWESIRLPAPVNVLMLEPIDPSALGGALAKTRPRAQRVQMTAGDQPVMLPTRAVDQPVELSMDGSGSRFALRYQLQDSTVRNTRGPAGRALGAVGPMMAGVPDDLPVAIMVMGRSVLNLVCPTERLSERACASGKAPRMRVNRTLPRRASVIGVQLDLGAPR